jgi:catechol 2,3-dioxygenase-like lactoylglutathione lyase family enzyme
MDWKLEVVVIPVVDVDRAKRFYSDQLGFNVDVDREVVSGVRVVQLTPPGSACSVTLGPLVVEEPVRAVQLQLVVDDIEAAHAQLVAAGVECSPVQHFEGGRRVDGRGEPWNSFVFFNDTEGNGWAVQEAPPREA